MVADPHRSALVQRVLSGIPIGRMGEPHEIGETFPLEYRIVDADGRVLGLDDEFFHSQGAYVRTHGARVPELTSGMLSGPYRIPAFRSTAHFRLTTKTPAATYRAPGRYETTFVRERLVDAIAAQLGMDRIEVRRRNTISEAELPYPRPLEALGEEIHYDTGDYIGLLDKLFAKIDWDKLNADVKTRKAAGELHHRIRDRLTKWHRATQPGAPPVGEPTVLTYAAYAGQLVAEHA